MSQLKLIHVVFYAGLYPSRMGRYAGSTKETVRAYSAVWTPPPMNLQTLLNGIVRSAITPKAVHFAGSSRGADEMKVPPTVFAPMRRSTRAERTDQGAYRRRGCHETA